jgi:hypothetical protein
MLAPDNHCADAPMRRECEGADSAIAARWLTQAVKATAIAAVLHCWILQQTVTAI